MVHKSYSTGFGSVPNSTPTETINDRSINPLIRIADTLEKHERYRTGEVTQLRRIADTLEEILRLVKKDQEESRKRWEEKDE